MKTTALTDALQVVQIVALVVALAYAAWQIRLARDDRFLSALWGIFGQLDDEDKPDARRCVYAGAERYGRLGPDGDLRALRQLPEALEASASRVCASLDRVGHLVCKGLVPAELILDGYHAIVGRCWLALEPWVLAQRRVRQGQSFMRHFQHLAELSYRLYTPKAQLAIAPSTCEGPRRAGRWRPGSRMRGAANPAGSRGRSRRCR